MKMNLRSLARLLVLCLLLGLFVGCTAEQPAPDGGETPVETVDYTAKLKLNMGTFTRKQEVTVKNFVDGDTVHFHISPDEIPGGVLKARFLAINTPESTGKIEPYGKAASAFTRERLRSAESIIVESDTAEWNADSTGSRYLVWVWYRAPGMTDYRNLNLEILQSGLAIASNTANNIYGSICTSALEQARALKLKVFSGEPDPDFYDGPAVELTLRELRTNIEAYSDMLVAFSCVIGANSNDTVYVEQYDEETDMYYGISVYYGNSGIGGDGLRILQIGNEVRIVGKVQYYETGGTWQISGLKYRAMRPDDPENIQLIAEGRTAAYRPTAPETLVNGTLTVAVTDADGAETQRSFPYAALAMNTSLSMSGLKVESVYTTRNEESSANGAMTLSCVADGVEITVRTAVLYDENGRLITESAYLGKTLDVRGFVDFYDGDYQIKVFTPDQLVIY